MTGIGYMRTFFESEWTLFHTSHIWLNETTTTTACTNNITIFQSSTILRIWGTHTYQIYVFIIANIIFSPLFCCICHFCHGCCCCCSTNWKAISLWVKKKRICHFYFVKVQTNNGNQPALSNRTLQIQCRQVTIYLFSLTIDISSRVQCSYEHIHANQTKSKIG